MKAKVKKPIVIFRADVFVADESALVTFLEPIPNRDAVRANLREQPGTCRMWDSETRRDFWIYSDGHRALCVTLAGLTVRQAASIRYAFDAIREVVPVTDDKNYMALLYAVVEKETSGGTFERVQ